MAGGRGTAHTPSDGRPASHTQRSGQGRSFIRKMPFCRRTASLLLEASCQGPGSRHLQGRHQQRQPGPDTSHRQQRGMAAS